MTTKERYLKIKNGLGKQVVVRNGKATISELDNETPIVSLAVKTLAEEKSNKVTYFAGRGRYTYGTIDLSNTGSQEEIDELESRVTILEQEIANIMITTIEEIEQLFN